MADASATAISSSKEAYNAKATSFLTALLNKTLRITISDSRMFLGEFKCTDNERNIILSRTYEYRRPPPPKSAPHASSVVLDMTSRYIGLVVVPGEFIEKIEVEEFTSQVRNGGSLWALGPESMEV